MNNPCIDCLTFPICRQRIISKLRERCKFPNSRYFEYYMYLAVKYKGCDNLFNYFKKEVSEVRQPQASAILSPKVDHFLIEMNMVKETKYMIYRGKDITEEDIRRYIVNANTLH